MTVSAVPSSKLRPPRVRHAEILRGALLSSDSVTASEILVVCAPAGYGKSTLAIQWAALGRRPVAWATFDVCDSDPLLLVATLSGSLSQAVAGFGPIPELRAEEPAYSREVLPGFLTAVSNLPTAVTVVLDDLHLLEGAASRRVVKAFVDALPSGSQVALLGRAMHAAPVPLWRGQGRVCELTADDLAFSAQETEHAVANFGSALEPAVVQSATSGWPVAVFLVSQSPSARSLTNIAEFIETEVLAEMDPDLRELVMVTAVLGAVNADLACELTGNTSAGQLLAKAITTVLMAPDDAGWYRYHPLLQDTVADAWRRDDPAGLRRVLAAAARWYLAHGFLDAAITQAIASGDPGTMGDVVWPAARPALLQGRTQTVLNWLEQIGPATVDAQPALSMTAAWANVVAGRYGHVLRHAQRTAHLLPRDWAHHVGDFSIGAYLALLLAVSHHDLDAAQALEFSRTSLAGLEPHDPVRPLATLSLALNLALVGDPAAQGIFDQAVSLAEASAISSTRAEALALWALSLIAQGDVSQGCQRAQQAAEAFARQDLGQMTSTAGVVALARVALATFRGPESDVRDALAIQAALTDEVEKIFAWYKPLSGAVLAFAYVRLGEHERYHEHLSWCAGSGLCEQWARLARLEYAACTPLTALTPAEYRVWELLKSRMTLSEIAETLFLSRETVKSHTGSIYRKLGVASRRQAQELAEGWQ